MHLKHMHVGLQGASRRQLDEQVDENQVSVLSYVLQVVLGTSVSAAPRVCSPFTGAAVLLMKDTTCRCLMYTERAVCFRRKAQQQQPLMKHGLYIVYMTATDCNLQHRLKSDITGIRLSVPQHLLHTFCRLVDVVDHNINQSTERVQQMQSSLWFQNWTSLPSKMMQMIHTCTGSRQMANRTKGQWTKGQSLE